MKEPTVEILLADGDPMIAGMVMDSLRETVDTGERGPEIVIRHTETSQRTLDLFYARPAEVVIAEMSLPDGDGISLIRKLREHADCSVLATTAEASVGKTVELMRLGVRDLFVKPFDVRRLSHAVQRAIDEQLQIRRGERRQRRLQQLASRIVRERRELRKRVDLVCNDLVGAYRDLASKFVEHTGEHAEKL